MISGAAGTYIGVRRPWDTGQLFANAKAENEVIYMNCKVMCEDANTMCRWAGIVVDKVKEALVELDKSPAWSDHVQDCQDCKSLFSL